MATIIGKWLKGYYTPQAKAMRNSSFKPSFTFDIDKVLGNLVNSFQKGSEGLFNSFTHAGMTGESKETMDYQQGLKEDFFNKYESLPAQMAQAKEAGINPMTLFGNGASVSSSSAPSPAASPGTDLLGTLLNFKLRQEDQRIERESIAEKRRSNDFTEQALESVIYRNMGAGYASYAKGDEIITLMSSRKAQIEADRQLALEKINTEKGQQALAAANVSKAEAETALRIEERVAQEIQNKYGDEYWQTLLLVERQQADLLDAQAKGETAKVKYLTQSINESVARVENMVKEGFILDIEKGMTQDEADILGVKKEYANANEIVGIVRDVTGAIGDVVGAGAGFLGALGKIKSAVAAGTTAAASAQRADTFDKDVNSRIREREARLRRRR